MKLLRKWGVFSVGFWTLIKYYQVRCPQVGCVLEKKFLLSTHELGASADETKLILYEPTTYNRTALIRLKTGC